MMSSETAEPAQLAVANVPKSPRGGHPPPNPEVSVFPQIIPDIQEPDTDPLFPGLTVSFSARRPPIRPLVRR